MKVAIVYETHTGTTGAAAEAMAEVVRAAGHECTVESIFNADGRATARADAIVLGAWTKGYFIIMQHPSDGMMDFIASMSITHKPVAVFTTYKLAIGSTLRQMANAAEAVGGKVTGMYRVKGPRVPEGFDAWVRSLDSGAAV
ncbi:MAG TPA: flavodoxin domain-containing protein [Anaerolineae bacterium]|jgi:flavodoxin|nr:flavodoxin domain-containing protein [Anaerolineae bacterium]